MNTTANTPTASLLVIEKDFAHLGSAKCLQLVAIGRHFDHLTSKLKRVPYREPARRAVIVEGLARCRALWTQVTEGK